jgi:hypothetical protein
MHHRHGRRRPAIHAALSVLLICASKQVCASVLWDWSCTGAGVTASGTLRTDDTPDARGFYQITGMTGTANGGTITGLQAAGTAIPGNSGFTIDNLISSTMPQLTMHGFGFSVSNGEYHNPFYQGGYLDYVSVRPYTDGAGAEPKIQFMAKVVP